MALFTGVQHLCTFNIVSSLIYFLLPNVWKTSYTISASIFIDVSCWPPYSTDKFISCVVLGSSQWIFHFGKEIVILWTLIGWVGWMFQNLPLPAAQEARDSSYGVIPCIVTKIDGVLYHQMSFSAECMWLRSLRQSERTTARDTVQHMRWTYPCYRVVKTEHQQRWTRWLYRTPSKHLEK